MQWDPFDEERFAPVTVDLCASSLRQSVKRGGMLRIILLQFATKMSAQKKRKQ
jgi:hypothetical protein